MNEHEVFFTYLVYVVHHVFSQSRIMVLNLLSLLTLIVSLFAKTNGIIKDLDVMFKQKENGTNFGLEQATTTPPPDRDCFKVPVPCWMLSRYISHKSTQNWHY